MPHKWRLTTEEKIKAIEEYLCGAVNTWDLAERYSIGQTTVCSWIRLYKTRGIEGLTPSKRNRRYSVEIERHAVQDYLTGSFSLNDVCVKYDISRHGMLQMWIKQYNSHKDFRQPNSGMQSTWQKGAVRHWKS